MSQRRAVPLDPHPHSKQEKKKKEGRGRGRTGKKGQLFTVCSKTYRGPLVDFLVCLMARIVTRLLPGTEGLGNGDSHPGRSPL